MNVAPSALPRALTLVSEVLDFEGASAFKVAGNTRAALRADKLVIYFPDSGTMRAAGRALADSLAGLPIHPLPFTAPLCSDHMVTWAMDPPRGAWMARGSWRLWLCSKVAGVMTSLRRISEESEFLDRFASRMSTDGIRVAHPTWRRSGGDAEAEAVPWCARATAAIAGKARTRTRRR